MSKVKSNKSLVSGACVPLYLLHLSLADNFWSLGLLGTAAAVVVTALMMFAIVGDPGCFSSRTSSRLKKKKEGM